MTITARPLIRKTIALATLGLAAVAILGAAFVSRGPGENSPSLPRMAEAPVSLPGGRRLHVQKYEVTVAEWNACHAAGGCTLQLRARPGHTPQTLPATGLSYADVGEYLAWITESTGRAYRLPTAAEWSYMARDVLHDDPDPIYTDPSLAWASSYLVEGNAPRALKASGSFSTSAEGVADLDGSVWEWTSDCYAGGADEVGPDRCPAFYVGGEHVAVMSYLVRDPARGGCAVGSPPAHLGMRLVTDRRPPGA